MKTWLSVLSLFSALALGFGLGRSMAERGVPAGSPATESMERERDEALARIAALEAQIQALQRGPAAAVPAVNSPKTPRAAKGGTDAAPAKAPDAAERARKVLEFTADLDEEFQGGDGDGVLSALRHLADIVPEGREAAMALAIRINDDVRGDGKLGLDQVRFYQSLSDLGTLDLMMWSLDHESPPGFRVLAAYSLPWALPHDKAVDTLVGALGHEKDVNVQMSMVNKLTGMNDGRAEQALIGMFGDRQRDGAIRAQIAVALALTKNAAFVQQVTDAREDPDERVRAAAQAVLVARNPPVDGYLVTTVFAGGTAAAAGVKPGDIVVTYDGHPARSLEELAPQLRDSAGRDGVPLVVYRGAAGEVTIPVRGGALGVQGRAVVKSHEDVTPGR